MRFVHLGRFGAKCSRSVATSVLHSHFAGSPLEQSGSLTGLHPHLPLAQLWGFLGGLGDEGSAFSLHCSLVCHKQVIFALSIGRTYELVMASVFPRHKGT